MRSGAILLVECDHCHLAIEAPLQRTVSGQWDSSGVNGYLAQQGWVSDPVDGNDYCGAACRRAATKGRKQDATDDVYGGMVLATIIVLSATVTGMVLLAAGVWLAIKLIGG